jgi:hypothetical protein
MLHNGPKNYPQTIKAGSDGLNRKVSIALLEFGSQLVHGPRIWSKENITCHKKISFAFGLLGFNFCCSLK